MASDVLSFPGSKRKSLSSRVRWLIGAAIFVLCFGAMVYFQVFTVIDRGYSNAFSAISFGVLLLAMGLWIVFLAPISHLAGSKKVSGTNGTAA